MLMFESDFTRPFSIKLGHDVSRTFYPRYHANTKNDSFIRVCMILKNMGVENHLFPLGIYHHELLDVDPRSNDLSDEQRLMIMTEIKINPWYYFREVVRIPTTGGEPIPYILSRANLALTWCYYNGIDVGLVQPRQTGKTIGTQAIMSHVMYFLGFHFEIAMLTKDGALIKDNVRRLRDIKETLPKWMILKNYNGKDEDNKEGLSYTFLENIYKTFTNAIDDAGADKLGRGMTSPTQHWDEIAFFRYIWTTFPAAVAATGAARKNAAERGLPHANIYTTTAGNPDKRSGKFAMDLFLDSCLFTEKLYDCKDLNDLHNTVIKNSVQGTKSVYCVYSHRQLGFTDDWLREQILRTKATQEKVDRDYLNLWKSSSDDGPIPPDLLDKINRNVIEPLYSEVKDRYILNWYLSEQMVNSEEFKNRTLIAGLDSSEMIGRDFTTFVILDSYDMSVVGTLRCNDSNVINLGNRIAQIMLKYRKMILVPECKSTGVAIVDAIINVLKENGINPWQRIFNLAVQKKDEREFENFNIHTEPTEGLNKKLFGFRTTGGTGLFSRNMLYKSTMLKAIYLNYSRVHDEMLIKEFNGLRTKNGRIDHNEDSHDDMIISYLLACFFIFFGKNLHHYGIKPELFLHKITNDEDGVDKYKKQEQLEVRSHIAQLEHAVRRSTSHLVRMSYERELNEIKRYLDDGIIDVKPIATTQFKRDSELVSTFNKPDTEQAVNLLSSVYTANNMNTSKYQYPQYRVGYGGIVN